MRVVSQSATQESNYTQTSSNEDMSVNERNYLIPQAWRSAILGIIAALPATVVLNWLPNSEANIAGGVMIIGAMVAGAIAVTRAIEPSAAGLRAGFLGGIIAILSFLLTEGMSIIWSANRVMFFILAVGMFVCVAPIFGAIFGKIGGRMATSVGNLRID